MTRLSIAAVCTAAAVAAAPAAARDPGTYEEEQARTAATATVAGPTCDSDAFSDIDIAAMTFRQKLATRDAVHAELTECYRLQQGKSKVEKGASLGLLNPFTAVPSAAVSIGAGLVTYDTRDLRMAADDLTASIDHDILTVLVRFGVADLTSAEITAFVTTPQKGN